MDGWICRWIQGFDRAVSILASKQLTPTGAENVCLEMLDRSEYPQRQWVKCKGGWEAKTLSSASLEQELSQNVATLTIATTAFCT